VTAKIKPLKKTDGIIKVRGFRASGIYAGIKKPGKGKDLALIVSDTPAVVAGVFTKNKVKAAPVLIDMQRVKKGISRGVVINSGNANVSTGKEGYDNALRMTAAIEKGLGLKKGDMLVASTGVIGVMPPVKKMEAGAKPLISELRSEGFIDAAEAIMTTDAFAKTSFHKKRIAGDIVTVAGIAKGAGMRCPDMATMLAFFVTDANIGRSALGAALKKAADASFNSIIVDNDMSTNDTVLIFANGASRNAEIKSGTPEFDAFASFLTGEFQKLALMIVKDGEGATRFIELTVNGAASDKDANLAARTIAESMLVKTAFFGGDPNWGRIIAALGRAGIKLRQNKVDISFNGVTVAKAGMDTGKEKAAAKALKVKDVSVKVGLGMGKGSKTIWTTDLTYEYVKINSAYRT
jgi:glutamate N-acetyltransferase/amino-acid N-acetyltransferase